MEAILANVPQDFWNFLGSMGLGAFIGLIVGVPAEIVTKSDKAQPVCALIGLVIGLIIALLYYT